MNEIKEVEIKWKIVEYSSVREKEMIPVFEALVFPTA